MSKIRVFKFGGASVKSADAVKNVGGILRKFSGEPLVVVISAMGKTTNMLERLHEARFHRQPLEPVLDEIHRFHAEIAAGLFGPSHPEALEQSFAALKEQAKSPCSADYDQEYDQLVCHGELISTALVTEYLNRSGLAASCVDARKVIRTDSRFRDARVDWESSQQQVHVILDLLAAGRVVVIQGFIGSDARGMSTTLGREGSDFTAAILAYLLDASDVTIWKDVPGMLNADPKWFENTVKLDRISFHEAIELAYYGASVIHPKTIKPLQNKGIPLHIKSFLDPDAPGSVIQESGDTDHLVPNYIFRDNQVLVSITPRDFSFVVEDNLREIFEILSSTGIRINLMENSAISFSICFDHHPYKLEQLFARLEDRYILRYNLGLTLMTIRHYNEETVKMLTADREVLMEQRSRHTMRLIMR